MNARQRRKARRASDKWAPEGWVTIVCDESNSRGWVQKLFGCEEDLLRDAKKEITLKDGFVEVFRGGAR